MPNADASEVTRMKKLRAQANDFLGIVNDNKFLRPSPDGIVPLRITGLRNFLPSLSANSNHNVSAAILYSGRKPKGFA